MNNKTEGASRRLTEAEYAEFQRQNGVLAEAWAPNGVSRTILRQLLWEIWRSPQ